MMGLSKAGNHINGIVGAGPLNVNVGHLKVKATLYSQLNHFQAVFNRRNPSFLLMWWICRRNEYYPAQS
jgi:hypothetical protein